MLTETWIYNQAKFPAETHLLLTMLTKQSQNLYKSNDGNIYGDTEQDRWMRTHTVLSWGPFHTLLTMIWERNKIFTDRPPVHTVTALQSFENGAKLKRNVFQFDRKPHFLSNTWGLLKLSVKVKTHLFILSITSTSKMILLSWSRSPYPGQMGPGHNILQGLFSWKGNEGWTQWSVITIFTHIFRLILGSQKSIISIS